MRRKGVSSYWFDDPAALFAVASALRFSAFGARPDDESPRPTSPFALASPLEFRPANPSRRRQACAQRSRLLSWTSGPFSTPGSGADLEALRPHGERSISRRLPPAGFGYPLGGSRSPDPCRRLFHVGGAPGIRPLRSVPLPPGIRGVSAGMNPCAVSPDTTRGFRGRRAVMPGRGLRALTLAEVPGGDRRPCRRCAAGGSPGVSLLQGLPDADLGPSRALLSHAFFPTRLNDVRGASQSVARSTPGPAPAKPSRSSPLGVSSPGQIARGTL